MVISIKNLTKYYGKLCALDDFSMDVKEGEIFGLLGPNGSGKTTTISCLLSLLKYEKGEISIFGKSMTPVAYDIKKDIGIVLQNVAVFQELNVYENIDYFCGLYVTDKSLRKELVMEAIDFTGLKEFKKFFPKKLSGGLLRRLNIACGIAHKPKLLILDEPTVAVDPQSRNKILEGIKDLNARGATVVYTSHYMEEVEQICTRITIMDKGKIVASGKKDELKESISLGETIKIRCNGDFRGKIDKANALPNLISVVSIDNEVIVKFKKNSDNLKNMLNFLEVNNIEHTSIYSELPTLNDVFLEITGKELRD